MTVAPICFMLADFTPQKGCHPPGPMKKKKKKKKRRKKRKKKKKRQTEKEGQSHHLPLSERVVSGRSDFKGRKLLSLLLHATMANLSGSSPGLFSRRIKRRPKEHLSGFGVKLSSRKKIMKPSQRVCIVELVE